MAAVSHGPEHPRQRPRRGGARRVAHAALPERLDHVALGLGIVGSLALVAELGYALLGRRGAEGLVALVGAGLAGWMYVRLRSRQGGVTQVPPLVAATTRRDRRIARRLGRAVVDEASGSADQAEAQVRPRRLRRHGRHASLHARGTVRPNRRDPSWPQ